MERMKKVEIKSPEEMIELGEKIGKYLEKNMVILMEGDLGAGKTTMTKGIAKALGINRVVNSPTFTIMKIYENGKMPLYHMDVYRLDNQSGDEYLEEYFENGGVTIIEWAHQISDILPQSYWAIEHGSAGYPDLIKWWAQVVKYKKVNLYAALGLYMRNEKGGSSWTNNDLEGYNQIMYGSKYDTVHGYSVYDFKSLRASASGSDRGFKKVNELWSKPAILPEIKTMDKIVIDTPKNLTVGKVNNGYRLQFDEVENAKFYVIYRSSKELTYSPHEVRDIIGNQSYEKIVNYVDLIDTKDNYYYGIKAQSYSLTLTDGVSIETTNSIKVDEAPIEKVDTIITSSNLIVNSKLDVKWRKIYHSLGDEINYELYYSTDANTWKKGENELELNDGNGYVSSSLKIPSNAKT